MKYMFIKENKRILITEMFIKKISYFYRDGEKISILLNNLNLFPRKTHLYNLMYFLVSTLINEILF
jgi:hypothetical protein